MTSPAQKSIQSSLLKSALPTKPFLTEPTTVLVTGGAGFIGSWFIRVLMAVEPQARVINLDALTYAGNLENLSDLSEDQQYRFVHGDIRDAALIQALMAEADYVVNFAAQTHVDRSISGPQIFVETNVLGTQTLLDAARHKNQEALTGGLRRALKGFLQISTDEVYGSLPLGSPERFTETHPLQPSSPYSASKASGDLLALSYFHTYGLPVMVTRCSNNYGPNQYPEKLIPHFILNLMAGKTVPVYGDGQNVRDWIHVVDHSVAAMRVLFNGTVGHVYNIGGNHELSNLDLTHQLLSLLGCDASRITYVTDRLGHDRRYAIDNHKIATTLEWTPKVPFEAGLAETIQWYQGHTGWISHIERRMKTLESENSATQNTNNKAIKAFTLVNTPVQQG